MINTILQGDSLAVLKTLPDGLIDCVVTSPPYWGLRDYGTAEWENGSPDCDHRQYAYPKERQTPGGRGGSMPKTEIVFKEQCGKCGAIRTDDQLGLEPTIEEYISKMTTVFREVRRVLKDTGVMFLNMGDGYNSANTHSGSADKVAWTVRLGQPAGTTKELKQKDMLGQPWRLAFALQADGWYLRSDIIWHKPNPMPESCTDRPTKSHEYVFLMSKRAQYFYDADAIKEPVECDASDIK